jgi:ABC-type multidrug transport system ATPase subunit
MNIKFTPLDLDEPRLQPHDAKKYYGYAVGRVKRSDTMKNDVILQTHELKKAFGTVRAVDGISLSVARGQVYGFLGPNGSGKTTTIGMILGLLHPTSGSISLFGELVTPYHTRALKRVGALMGAPALLPYMSARQNLELLSRLSPKTQSTRIEEVLELVGLAGDAKRRAGQFSTGMKQRLGIAMSLLHEPELLILDEPTNGMDPAGMFDIRNLLSNLSDQGVTVFISSHLLHEIEQICDRVAVLKQGRMIAEGQVSDLIDENKTVKLRVPSPKQTVQLLQQLSDCLDIRSNGAYVTVSGLQSERIVAHLVSNGVVPSEVKTEGLDLEHIYLQLTNGESMEANHVLESVMD